MTNMSSNDCSLLCSLQFWTLKYPGLHERDINIHSYQQKPIGTKQSLLPFLHSSSNTDAAKQKATYYDEYNEYFTSRSLPFHLSNKIFQNLRDKLIEFDQLLDNYKLIRTIWIRSDVIFIIFSNGFFVFLFIDKQNRTLKNLLIDKTTLAKKFHITTTIADLYLNSFGFYVIYETQSKIDIFRFQTPIRSFDSKFNLANESIRLISEELPPYSNTIPIRRWFHIDHNHSTLTIWWTMLTENFGPNIHLIDHEEKKSRFNCLAVIFQFDNENEKEKLHRIQTETLNPYFCSATSSGLTTIEMIEHIETDRHYELNIYYYENFRSIPLRLIHIPLLSSPIQYTIRSTNYTIICLIDSTLISIDEINHVQRSKLAVLKRNLTGLWWIIDNLLFALADEQGGLIFYDISLNSISPVLSSYEKFNLCQIFNLNKSIQSINQLLITNRTYSNLTLLIQLSPNGPIGLLDIHYPFSNIHSLFKFYLNNQNSSYYLDLLWSLDWSRQDHDCRLAISLLIQNIFSHLNSTNHFYIEQILRTFYSPLRPISDASILRNRSFINQLAQKYFYYLLKEKFFTQAYQLAKYLDNRMIFIDLYYLVDYENEKTIRNLCAQYLLSNDNDNNKQNDDSESDLSVTSSEDEQDKEKIIFNKFQNSSMNDKQYSDINEILTSAIQHYKFDENMFKFLLDRIHAVSD